LNAGTGAGTGTGSGIGTGGAESPFSLSIKSYWEGDTGKAFPASHDVKLISKDASGVLANTGTSADLSAATCQIDPGTTKSDLSTKRDITCGVAIHRAQLYFSSLDLEIHAGKTAECDIVYYWPYGYRAGSDPTFTSRWQTTPLDCSGSSPPAACYSGPITDMPEFPKFTGLYQQIYDKTKSYSYVFSVESANKKNRRDNRWTSYRRLGLPGGNRSSDWQWQCVEKGDSLNFNITLRIIPIPDDPFNDGAPFQHFGWLDDDGNDRGLYPTYDDSGFSQ
jgi:hypothetical protein